MNQTLVEENLKASYRTVSAQYRRDDEIEVTTENHRRLHRKLADLCRSFSRQIHVLEAGCGSGRYFHCLPHVDLLTGLDLSPDMLEAARHPVCPEEISAKEIRLVCDSIYRADFPEGSFDFIYSLGMFGHGAPVTPEICQRFYRWLAPGGVLFFNTVHESTAGARRSWKGRIRDLVYPMLPGSWKQKLDDRAARLPAYMMNESDLERVVRCTPFENMEISTYTCPSPLWQGAHLECVARKR